MPHKKVQIHGSLRFRLLMVVIVSFTITAVAVFWIASAQQKQILNTSQEKLYQEKLDNIIKVLEQANKRLKATQMVEAYKADIQEMVLSDLSQLHYHENPIVYPFILDTQPAMVMHPTMPRGDTTLSETTYIKKVASDRNGNHYYTYKTGQEKWCTYKYFEPWGWVIAYTLPTDVKYAELYQFQRSLVTVMFLCIVPAIILLSWMLRRMTQPIVHLTRVSQAMTAGDLDQEIDITTRDEIGILAASLGQMRDSIKEKIKELMAANAILETTNDLVSCARPDRKLTYMNRAGRELLGWSPTEDLKDREIASVHPAWAFEKVRDEGLPTVIEFGYWQAETAILGKDGQEIPVSQLLMAHHSESGELEYLSTIMRDISERKQHEEELQENLRRHELQQSTIAMISLDDAVTAGDLTAATKVITEMAVKVFKADRLGI